MLLGASSLDDLLDAARQRQPRIDQARASSATSRCSHLRGRRSSAHAQTEPKQIAHSARKECHRNRSLRPARRRSAVPARAEIEHPPGGQGRRHAELPGKPERRPSRRDAGRPVGGTTPSTRHSDRRGARPRTTEASSGSRCSTSAVPYVWGGASPCGFDCSGLVMYVYAQVGVSLPHYTRPRSTAPACRVALTELQPGDLVFFYGLGHVGHLHRRRAVHPRAAHGRRREDLVAQRLLVRVDLRRRPPPLGRDCALAVGRAEGLRTGAENAGGPSARL